MDNNKPHLIEEIMYLIIGLMVVLGALFGLAQFVLNALGIPVSWN